MKKMTLIFLITLFGMINNKLYGQDIPQKSQTVYFPSFYHFILDPGTASLGIGYEHMIVNLFAIGGEFIVLTNFNDNVSLYFIGNLKCYPIKTQIGNMYVDVGFGYRQNRSNDDVFHSLIGLAHTGWKFIFKNGFFIEPGIGIGFYGNEKYRPDFVSRIGLGWTF